MRKRLALAAAAALALSSCATTHRLVAPEREALAAAAASMAGAAGEEGSDFASRGLYALLERLAEKGGPEAAAELAGLRSPGELGRLLSTRSYATTPYEAALEAFMAWDRRSTAPRWEPKRTERLETEHFALVTLPGTAGHEDREELAALLEEQVRAIEAILRPDAAMRARFAANMASLASGKVEVILPPDSRAFPGFGDTAQTSWGFTMGEGGLGVVASINLPYYNPLSSAILAHELTHLLDIFYKLDLEAAPPIPGRGEDLSKLGKKGSKALAKELQAWADGVFVAIMPNDTAFGEGFAEYVAGLASPLRRALLGSPDESLRAMAERVELKPDILSSSPTVKDRRIRIVRYTELHSFVAYLIEEYGMERFLGFYLQVPLAEANFEAAYGASYRELEAAWRKARGFSGPGA